MRKRYMALNCTQAETAYRLKQQLRVYPPRGIVEENYFKIYKKTGLFWGRGIRDIFYCFRGNYQQSGKSTYVSYQVWSDLSIVPLFLVLDLMILLALYDVLVKGESLVFAVIFLGLGVLVTLVTQLEKKKCIEDFEKQFSTQIYYQK